MTTDVALERWAAAEAHLLGLGMLPIVPAEVARAQHRRNIGRELATALHEAGGLR